MVDITLHGLTAEQAQRVCAALDEMKTSDTGVDVAGIWLHVMNMRNHYAAGQPTRTRDARLAAYDDVLRMLTRGLDTSAAPV